MQKVLYLIRHGVIQSNIEHRYSGRSSEELLEIGLEGADRLGRELQGMRITVIFTSPVKRALQTAEALNRHLQARLIIEPGLLEMDLGPWTGLSRDEVAKRYPSAYSSWVENPATFSFDKIETLKGVQERTVGVINAFFENDSDEAGVMVTHAVVVKTAFLHLNRLPLDSYHKIPVPNLSVHKVACDNEMSECTMVRIN